VTERLFRVKINQPTDPWRNRIARVASTKTRESDSFDFAGSRGRERAGAFPSSERSSSATRDGARNGSFVRSVARARVDGQNETEEGASAVELSLGLHSRFFVRDIFISISSVSPHQLCVTLLSG
jgi:hypothetical protein